MLLEWWIRMGHEVINITVDKSHIITIGERLYTESVEFVRELVNNAYDADATLVEIKVSDERIEVIDNGTGMDREDLAQYFNIGSQHKLYAPKSPVYGRDRIGQFGIGKFATLSACKRFVVVTKKGDFVGRVVFDKEEWEKTGDTWHLPLETLPSDARSTDGTTIILEGLRKKFDLKDIEAKIIEGTPLNAPSFRVKLNGRTITPRSLTGHRIPFLEGTRFGPVSGEIVILPESAASTRELGIAVKVKQVTVTREMFGMETWGKVAARIRGEVHADFLPITSDRTGFIKDSPQYQAFQEVMERIINEVRAVLQRLSGRRESRKISRALNEALQKVYRALAKNPDLSPFGAIPIGDATTEGIGGAAVKRQPQEDMPRIETIPDIPKRGKNGTKKRRKKPKVRQLTPNAVIKRVKFGEAGVSCCIDSFGEEGPEVFTEDTVIYINRDHPLYKREAKKMDTHVLNLARLITQEISLMKDPRNPRQAFERQSKLLKDAFVE